MTETSRNAGFNAGPPLGTFENILAVATSLCGARGAHVALANPDGSVSLAGTTELPAFDERLRALCVESIATKRQLLTDGDGNRLPDGAQPSDGTLLPDGARLALDRPGRRNPQARSGDDRTHILIPLIIPGADASGVLCIQDASSEKIAAGLLEILDALADETAVKVADWRRSVRRLDTVAAHSRLVDMLVHDAQGVLNCLAWQFEGSDTNSVTRAPSNEFARAAITELQNTLDDLSRIHQKDLTEFEPNFALSDLQSWFRSLCERARIRANRSGIRLESSLSLDQQYFRTDVRLLDRIAHNLTANAFAVSRPGDTVVLSIEQLGPGGFCLSVDDDGPGIPDDELPKIFEPYFTRRKADGTGLGLSICRAAAEKLGGQVEYMPRPVKGSRFEFACGQDAHGELRRAARRRGSDAAQHVAKIADLTALRPALPQRATAQPRARSASLCLIRERESTRTTRREWPGRKVTHLAGSSGSSQQRANGLRLIGEMLADEAAVRRGHGNASDRVDRLLVS